MKATSAAKIKVFVLRRIICNSPFEPFFQFYWQGMGIVIDLEFREKLFS
jgi:hypothetical protein